MAPAILDTDEQNRFIAHLTRAGVEYRMSRIGPVPSREDRVGGMALEQLRVQVWRFRFSNHSVSLNARRLRELAPGHALAISALSWSPNACWISQFCTSA